VTGLLADLTPVLDERWLAATAAARTLDHGGIAAVPLKPHKFHGEVELRGVPKVKCQVSLPTRYFISFQALSSQ
jgi:hypothetical protein